MQKKKLSPEVIKKIQNAFGKKSASSAASASSSGSSVAQAIVQQMDEARIRREASEAATNFSRAPQLQRIITPNGKCPFKLNRSTQEHVEAWVLDLQEYGLNKRELYTEDALCYWVGQFFDQNNHKSDYNQACFYVHQVLCGKTTK